jgi:anti-sigma regulatory factor (Ser/Thr protein kinase)
MRAEHIEELVLAVDELATNSIRHGGGSGTLRCWREGEALLCEVQDRGWIDAPLVGRRRPDPEASSGRGVWLANQLCDLVQIRSSSTGTVVRVHKRLG